MYGRRPRQPYPDKDIVAVDLWHAGAVLVASEEVVEIVVREDIPPE